MDEAIGDDTMQTQTRRFLIALLNAVGDTAGANRQRDLLIRQSPPAEGRIGIADLVPVATHLRRSVAEKEQQLVAIAQDKHPEDLRVSLGRSVDEWLAKKEADAQKTVFRIVQRHPDYLPAAGFSAVLMAHDQDYLSLLDLLSRYESTPSTNPQLWYARGRLHQHLGHHSQALACYARSMRHGCVLRSVPSRMVECLEVISADGDVSQNIDMRVSKGDVALATRHATDVLQLRGLCRRVNANGTVSQTVCFSLAQTLMRLGREDQARHWAAIGFRS
ncbi:MAG: hypothetical protein AAFN70_21285, partial [Planctomycetota bacterium]